MPHDFWVVHPQVFVLLLLTCVAQFGTALRLYHLGRNFYDGVLAGLMVVLGAGLLGFIAAGL